MGANTKRTSAGTRGTRSPSAATTRRYEDALREAGVSPKDLQLLRELAAANAKELDVQSDHLRPSRVLI